MATTSPHAHITILAYKMYRHKHPKPTFYQASNIHSCQLVNCVMTIALQFSQKIIAPYTTNTKNLSSTVSETIPRVYMNNVYPRPTIKPTDKPMQRCQQKTSQNTLNTFINVPSLQPLAHGCKLSEKAISKPGPELPSKRYNATYQNPKQQPWDIWTNNEKTYNPPKSSQTTLKPWLHQNHLKMDNTHTPCMRQPSATMNQQANSTLILPGDFQFKAAEETNIYSSPIISIPILYMSNHSKVDMITTP